MNAYLAPVDLDGYSEILCYITNCDLAALFFFSPQFPGHIVETFAFDSSNVS